MMKMLEERRLVDGDKQVLENSEGRVRGSWRGWLYLGEVHLSTLSTQEGKGRKNTDMFVDGRTGHAGEKVTLQQLLSL
jgi:hypothetical protein